MSRNASQAVAIFQRRLLEGGISVGNIAGGEGTMNANIARPQTYSHYNSEAQRNDYFLYNFI